MFLIKLLPFRKVVVISFTVSSQQSSVIVLYLAVPQQTSYVDVLISVDVPQHIVLSLLTAPLMQRSCLDIAISLPAQQPVTLVAFATCTSGKHNFSSLSNATLQQQAGCWKPVIGDICLPQQMRSTIAII